MKRLLPLLMLLLFVGSTLSAQRYLSEVFTGVDVTADVVYGGNVTIITGTPAADTLLCDVYTPQGDTASERPVVLISHTGSFLPVPLNGQATGYKDDSTVVELCTQLAKRGYTAVAYTYRLGWNPVGTQEERTGTLLNAAYRGIQDTWTLVRFIRLVYQNGNPYGVDTSKIIVGGVGTGGYMGLGAATLDKYAEINLAKFINPGTGTSYVDTAISGDIYGELNRPINVGNHVGQTNKFHFAFNLGGALGDSTWLEAGDVPMVSFHGPSDPFAPYDFGAVIVPTTGDFVVNVSGSQGVQRRSNRLGNNAPFQGGTFTDPVSMEADTKNDGYDGLFPFFRPFPPPEGSPWDWWDTVVWNVPHPSGGTFNSAGRMTNPDMSAQKARTYIDTIQAYLNPRIVCALNLPGCTLSGLFEDLDPGAVTLYPNPSQDFFVVESAMENNRLVMVEVLDLQGRIVKSIETNSFEYTVRHEDLNSGLYLVKIRTEKGIVTKKVLFD